MTILKTKSRFIAVRSWWEQYYYWLPTMMTSYHSKKDGALTSLSVKDESYQGSHVMIEFHFLGGCIDFSFWWDLEKVKY